jgi:hypothetical protein
MKISLSNSLLLIVLLPLSSLAQLNNGGLYANFGVDADTRSNYMKYGLVTGAVSSDDWFAPSGTGYNVIDTSNAATYLAQLQAHNNISFSKRMSQLLYAKVNGKLWLDAAYGRDYSAASTAKDSTVFTISAKNGDNPTVWKGGVANTPNKNDLVDVYAHMRRDGTSVFDSLWFFTAITSYGNTGNAYYDVELYKNSFGYNSSTGTFSSAGTANGHTEWLFDASGNIIQTGDLIVALSFYPGSPPDVDVRIWVSQTTFNNYYGGALTPAYFDFNGSYSSSSGGYGYASIVSKTGTTAFGAGISNYTGSALNDTTYATPWGSNSSTTGWSMNYQIMQLNEVGLNLTRIGLDPALYRSTLNPCQSLFSNIFFASRSSSSFTANLQDFVTPLTFLRPAVMDYTESGDTLRCNHQTGVLNLTNVSTAGYYTWKTLNGGVISGANSDSSQVDVSKPGTYIVSASPATGCPPTRVDTLVVPIDTFPPIASAFSGLSGYQIALYGGNEIASNYPTPFGGSKGLLWNWNGPDSFSSTSQSPYTDTVWGTYNLTVTEKRNGCTATASTTISRVMFTFLLDHGLQLQGNYNSGSVSLDWQDQAPGQDISYTVERSSGNGGFQAIGTVSDVFKFIDANPVSGNNFYRIKATSGSGEAYYSPTITIATGSSGLQSVTLIANDPGQVSLLVKTTAACNGALVEYSIVGQTLEKKMVSLAEGTTTIDLPSVATPSAKVIALYLNGKLAWSQKIF